MERAVEIFAVVNFTVIGLSHIVRPRAWVQPRLSVHPGIGFLVLAALLVFHLLTAAGTA